MGPTRDPWGPRGMHGAQLPEWGTMHGAQLPEWGTMHVPNALQLPMSNVHACKAHPMNMAQSPHPALPATPWHMPLWSARTLLWSVRMLLWSARMLLWSARMPPHLQLGLRGHSGLRAQLLLCELLRGWACELLRAIVELLRAVMPCIGVAQACLVRMCSVVTCCASCTCQYMWCAAIMHMSQYVACSDHAHVSICGVHAHVTMLLLRDIITCDVQSGAIAGFTRGAIDTGGLVSTAGFTSESPRLQRLLAQLLALLSSRLHLIWAGLRARVGFS